MAMTAQVKAELASTTVTKTCCRKAEVSSMLRFADALLIAGSSLVVNSGIRLLEQASRRRLPIVIINRGLTKGDAKANGRVLASAFRMSTKTV